tara:strand:+ start:2614 stop:2859 length:246 start_codon:yes stop_codon:yes gene_type:complete
MKMAKNKKEPESKTLEILGVTYNEKELNDMSPEVRAMLSHRQDLINKIQKANFNLVQMQFGLKAFEERLLKHGIGKEQKTT